MDNVVMCSECSARYRVKTNGRKRGPGTLACPECGEDLILWTCEDSDDLEIEPISEPPATKFRL
jgi:hydrogenase maturation factor HypF (carbamoyltransferase family)